MDETAMIPREELQQLARLPSSADLEERLERLKREKDQKVPVNPRWIRAAEKKIERGKERDRLAEMRPEGCFCLGIGILDGKACDCPEGRAAEAEQQVRAERRRRNDIAEFIERSGIPPRFRQFSFDTYPQAGSKAVHRVRTWQPTEEKPGLFLYGHYGSGKSGLAISALREFVERECAGAQFRVVPDLLDAIRREYAKDASGDDYGMVARAKSCGFLVLDDLGAEKPSEWVAEKLYQLVNYRHGHLLATVFTSNLTLDELAGHIGERTTWRIAEMCEVVKVEGANLRAVAS